MIADVQIRKLLKFLGQGKSLEAAAAMSGMDEKTARKYRRLNKLPSDIKAERCRSWRTRSDPLGDYWGTAQSFLEMNQGLEAKALFTYLQRENPGRIPNGQLRTFQRRVRSWRAAARAHEVFFPKRHEPGKTSRGSFRNANALQVKIAGKPFEHLVYLFILPYSNWETGSVFLKDDFEALSTGLQKGLWSIGGVPKFHRTDDLMDAAGKANDPAGFVRRYRELLDYYQLRPLDRLNPDETQSVEQRYRHFEKALDHALILRGSRDFCSLMAYERFLQGLFEQLNKSRLDRYQDEQKGLHRLPLARWSDEE